MLELKDVTFRIQKDGEDFPLLQNISLKVPKGHFMAIVGPSGCGKTTLLKTIAGLIPESDGGLFWDERNLSEGGDFLPSEIGYVPQFSIAYDPLTVDESIEAATRLRVRTRNGEELDDRIDRVLAETGLDRIADRPVHVLSGGQKRRLGLAMELVSDPDILLCDEVTSGLDPRSEREIVHLLHALSRKDGRVVLSVTHSLSHFELYDSILVLHEGRVAFHGPPDKMTHYFSVQDTEEIYPRLATQPSDRWQSSWLKHRESYEKMLKRNREKLIENGSLQISEAAKEPENDAVEDKAARKAADTQSAEKNDERKSAQTTSKAKSAPLRADVELPGLISQFTTLLSRRWKIFFRDRGQVLLQIAILLCFPVLVILFADRAQGNISRYSDMRQSDIIAEIQEQKRVMADQAKVGSAVSGIIMFQVVLLALMGSNNSAREIAGERLIYEKEKFGGLRPSAYIGSKIAFLACLVIIQSLWMAFFVNMFGAFRGDFFQHVGFLLFVNAAMTTICLTISAWMRTAEQASLLSIYLVGFQLPLSGAVLALPEKIEVLTRPFISAYWAWSGSVESLQTQVHDAVKSVIETSLSPIDLCQYILTIHILVAILFAWLGARRPQWD